MSSSDISRSERVLDKIGAKLGITEEGKKWVIAAVDPWHDVPVNCRGYPDVSEAASVVQVVKMSTQVSISNFNSGQTAPWDCHVHQFPWMLPCDFTSANYSAANDQYGDLRLGNSKTTPGGASSTPSLYGGLSIGFAATSGGPTFQWTANNTINPFASQLQPYLTGQFRIIAMGFEVINTTSDLNIQGLCTVYRQPMANIDSAKTTLVTGGLFNVTGNLYQDNVGYPSVVQTSWPPLTTTSALLLDGTKQWKAKEGCYVVSTLNSDEIPAGVDPASPVMSVDPNDSTVSGWKWGYPIGTGVANNAAWNLFQIPIPSGNTYSMNLLPTGNSFLQPFNHAGAFFTGLSPETTLTVNAIYYIERFPSQQDTDLVVLATNSCREDTVARDLYSEIIKEMPVGVPQRMNGLGEWFNNAVSSAVDFVSPVLSAIPHPMAQAAALGAKTIKGVSNAALGSKQGPGSTYAASGSNAVKTPVAHAVQKKKKVPMGKK